MRRAASYVLARLPAGWIRWLGRLQFRPVMGPVVRWVGRSVLAKEGVIRHGLGAGLHFDATHGAPGYLFGTSEPDEQAILSEYLKPGNVCYDIGANVGFFATLAARLVGKDGRVYAFEPNPVCAAQARKNAALNGFDHLEVVEAAVSSSSGRVRLHFGETSTMSSSIVWTAAAGDVEVAMVSVDEFVRNSHARGPTLVMIDAEGAEVEVLKGMHDTIRRHRPVILCEVHWINDEFLGYCAERLAPLGYVARPLTGDTFPTRPDRFHALLTPMPAVA